MWKRRSVVQPPLCIFSSASGKGDYSSWWKLGVRLWKKGVCRDRACHCWNAKASTVHWPHFYTHFHASSLIHPGISILSQIGLPFIFADENRIPEHTWAVGPGAGKTNYSFMTLRPQRCVSTLWSQVQEFWNILTDLTKTYQRIAKFDVTQEDVPFFG